MNIPEPADIGGPPELIRYVRGLEAENERLRASRSCLLAGRGRGDCEHFIGWPEVEDETTTDEWGVPTGWCIVCYWRHKALASERLAEIEWQRQAHDVCCAGADTLTEQVDALRAENERLRAEIDKCPCNLWHEGLVADLG